MQADFVTEIKGILKKHNVDPEKGLGEDLFLLVSCLVPVVNIDLIVYGPDGRFLLTKRKDPYCGTGWHFPGGCLRFKESLDIRVRKVAFKELGIENLIYDKSPFKVLEFVATEPRPIIDQNIRAHFITMVYKCQVNSDYVIDNKSLNEDEAGYIKWFDKLPDDLIKIHDYYRDFIK